MLQLAGRHRVRLEVDGLVGTERIEVPQGTEVQAGHGPIWWTGTWNVRYAPYVNASRSRDRRAWLSR